MSERNFYEMLKEASSKLCDDGNPDELILLHTNGIASTVEVFGAIYEYFVDAGYPADLLVRMGQHTESWVHGILEDIRELERQRLDCLAKIDSIETSSPLQPGVAIKLHGGYSSIRSPWLRGNQAYHATFLYFRRWQAERMPIAVVELDQYYPTFEAGEQTHGGKYALLKLWYVASWEASGTVSVYIVEQVPDDMAAFFSVNGFGTELESHVSYEVL